MAPRRLKKERPTPGHVWVDTDADESGLGRRFAPNIELLMLLRKAPGRSGFDVWEILVTRADGSTVVDWENIDNVEEWYEYEPEYLKRVV